MTADRCDVTDLLTEQCAHCRGLPDLPTDHPEPRHGDPAGYTEGPIVARYPGWCGQCGKRVHPGTRIVRDDQDSVWLGECCQEVPA